MRTPTYGLNQVVASHPSRRKKRTHKGALRSLKYAHSSNFHIISDGLRIISMSLRSRPPKSLCDDLGSIDVNFMNRNGLLVPGLSSTLSWRWRRREGGTVRFSVFPDSIFLDYRVRIRGSDCEPVSEFIPLTRTPQPFGGERIWFVCPSCQTLRAVLFVRKFFRCRNCHDLSYRTRNENGLGRNLLGASKIKQRLGGGPGVVGPFPERPKGMHERTYFRLMAQYERFVSAAVSASGTSFRANRDIGIG